MRECGKLSLSQQKIFVELVDRGAPPKAFAKQLGLSLEDIRKELVHLASYRKSIELADKISEIRKSSMTKKVQQKKIEELRGDNKV